MKNNIIILFVFVFYSCATIIYTPKISLPGINETINKSVKVIQFIDSSPLKDKKTNFSRASITSPTSYSGELDFETTELIVTNFAKSGLFKTINSYMNEPDYVMKGEIKKFSGFNRANNFTNISSTFFVGSITTALLVGEPIILLGAVPFISVYFGVPTGEIITEVDLTIRLYDKNNSLVGTYEGKSKQSKITSVYKNKGVLFWHSLMNKTLNDAVMQTRQKIVTDKNLLEK
jgi:hypothetical protein